jgi:hypothetical protein
MPGALPIASAASTEAACDDPAGVTVVVDFGDLGGGVQMRCAGWPVTSGLDALDRAGFDTALVLTQPGFVCRIDGKPADDPCQVTPPGDAYWAYYEAARGGSWRYSIRGPAATRPEPGSVEGWAFGDSRQPGVPPPPVEEPTQPPPTQSTPPPTSPPASQPVPPQSTPGSATPSPTAPIPPSDPTPTVDSPSPTAAATVASEAGASDAGSPTTGGSATAGTAEPSSPVGILVAAAAVLLLGGAAWVTAWRRRRGGEQA